ncbi:FolC bifunctional protein [Lindgomyces ingoldianus]|uniref:FolC bifunctional protein n=1 Tax=Lindgomyces ingoldianus TaxID=673940 RepID=A0ACB6QK98_9PLEO|nr:FolC bifunctional protein [Lindgomyces ingoldianus]KAF2467003.1 FolC bifunctional protein [Lindgomyces ingoldianus]
MIKPGLERIGQLLKDVHLPWKSIHVAGTNGKGSICAYASALLTRRCIKTGCFTSPHLIHRWDGITINHTPVPEHVFKRVEQYFLDLNEEAKINASPFEILTATAFKLFTDQKVEVGVVEVGMGGKLDATNILNNQVVSVIARIAHDHHSFLGHSLDEIASHKAGILRPGVPYLVNPTNEWHVQQVVADYAKEIGAGPLVELDTEENREELFKTKAWHELARNMLPFQRDNAVLAYFAVIETLKGQHMSHLKARKLLPALKKKNKNGLPGRMQLQRIPSVFGSGGPQILIDGAHNEDAAVELNRYINKNLRNARLINGVPEGGRPITWVVAMSEGKDAHKFLSRLLKARDRLVATSFEPVDGMPWVKPMQPKHIADTVHNIQWDVTTIQNNEPGVLKALCTAKYLRGLGDPIVVTGSLYLVGQLLREMEEYSIYGDSRLDMPEIDRKERNHVNAFLSDLNKPFREVSLENRAYRDTASEREEQEIQVLQREIEALNKELERVNHEERDLKKCEAFPKKTPSQPREYDTALNEREDIFAEFEAIRKQLDDLSPPPSSPPRTTERNDNNLKEMVKNVPTRRSIEDVMADPVARVPIRTHFAISKDENEKMFRPRIIRPIRHDLGPQIHRIMSGPPKSSDHDDK